MPKRFSSIPSAFIRHLLPALATFTSVILASLVYLMLTPRLYETSSRIILDEKKVSVSDLGKELAQVSGGNTAIATQAELVKSTQVLERAIALAKNGVKPGNEKDLPTMPELAQGLRAKIVPATNILELSYRGSDPELTADLLNAVMNAMIQENIENIRAGARSVKTFLDTEVPKQRDILRQAEQAENRYRQANGLISIGDQTRRIVESLDAVESQERDLLVRLREVATRNGALERVINAGSLREVYESVRIGQDEELRALRVRLVDLETKVIDGRSRLGDQHPELLALTEQRDETRALYRRKLALLLPGQTNPPSNIAGDPLSQDLASRLITGEIERFALGQRLLAVKADRLNLQARLADFPIKQQPLANLTRRREEAEANLKLLQVKLQEATIAEAQLVSNLQIVSKAYPPATANSPKKPAVLATAIVFGAILMVAIVLVLELLDDTLHDPSEAEELLGQSSLATLPLLPVRFIGHNQFEAFLNDSHLVEPYRKLLKLLEFRSVKKLRLLVLSSTMANEGKSTVASHLAAVSAMLSQRTLLIDADLRQPKQHELFDLAMEPGLTQSVDGELSLKQAVQSTGIQHLSVLTCGKLPQRPSLVLESPAMKTLLEEAADSFDLVIVDTPSVISCGDAMALCRHSDGLLFLMRPGVLTRKGLAQSFIDLERNGMPLMGVVTNGVHQPPSQQSFDDEDGHRQVPNFLRRLPRPKVLSRWFAFMGKVLP